MHQSHVTIVVPIYNRWDLVQRLLSNLDPLPPDWDIVLVDDASPEPPPDRWLRDSPSVLLIRHDRNTGFAGAVNSGVAHARGEILCVLNSDVTASVEGLAALATRAATDDVILGPKSLSPQGEIQPVPRRFHDLPRLLAEYFVPLRLIPPLDVRLRDFDYRALSGDELTTVEWVVGSCLVFSRRVWDRVGPMDERFHMHSEEMDWQLTAREVGVRVQYVPEVVVSHDDGGSAADHGDSRFLSVWTSHLLFVQKRHGDRAVRRLRRGMTVLYVLMTPAWFVAHLLPRVREKTKVQRRRHCTALRLPTPPPPDHSATDPARRLDR